MLVENEEIRIIEKNDFCYIEFKALDKYKHKVKCIYSLKDHDVDFSRKFHPWNWPVFGRTVIAKLRKIKQSAQALYRLRA